MYRHRNMLEQRLLHGFSKWGPRARARQGAGGNAPGPHFWRKEEIASDHQMWQVVVGGRHFSTRPGRHFPMLGPCRGPPEGEKIGVWGSVK